MAITGDGSEQTPWVVHDYDELISLSGQSPYETTYIKLANNINCNTYGTEFKWGSFHVNERCTTVIDFDGHTIKNVLVKDNASMFTFGHNSSQYGDSSFGGIKLKNGNLLNVFFASPTSRMFHYGRILLENMSISVNSSGLTVPPFDGVYNSYFGGHESYIDNSAIYVETAKLNSPMFYGKIEFSDSDIMIKVGDQNTQEIFTNNEVTFDNCRLRGKIAGRGLFMSNPYYENVVLDNAFENSVIELDVTEVDENGDIYGNWHLICTGKFNEASQTTVIGTEDENGDSIFPDHSVVTYVDPTSWQYCSYSEIRDADYLNSHGFIVTHVIGG